MTEFAPIDPYAALLADQVFEAGQVVRARDRAIRDAHIRNAEITRQRDGSAEAQLAEATDKLSDRLVWLHEHPRLSRFIGKSALDVQFTPYSGYRGIKGVRGQITTNPVPDGEVFEYRGEQLMVSGLMVRRYYSGYAATQSLYIDREAHDENALGISMSQRLFKLYPYSNDTGPRVQIEGIGFDEYRQASRRQIFLDYIHDNPWAGKYGVWYREADQSTHTPRGEFVGYHRSREEDNDIERLNKELAPQLERGGGWDYPDEMFLNPIGFVQHMNMMLSTKNK